MRLGLNSLLMLLFGRSNAEAIKLFWAIVFWIAAAIDIACGLLSASSDPMLAPSFKGPKGKTCNMPMHVKMRIAQIAARGEIFKSGRAVVMGGESLGNKMSTGNARAANKWNEPKVLRYVAKTEETFDITTSTVPIYCFTWDATRLSGGDTLVTGCYYPQADLACWTIPQDFRFVCM